VSPLYKNNELHYLTEGDTIAYLYSLLNKVYPESVHLELRPVKDTDKIITGEFLDELIKFHNTYPEREVKMELSLVLYYGMNSYLHTREKFYEYLILLYKLRHDLPEEPNKFNNIKEIENCFLSETVKLMEREYNKSREHLKAIIQKIQGIFRDETEFVLLMNKISFLLPFEVQKVLWEILSS
jgi:hypothetical protein